MASLLFMDWETQSDSDLPVTGTLRYVLDPSTRPLLLSWAWMPATCACGART